MIKIRYSAFLILIFVLLPPLPASPQVTAIDPSSQPTFKEPPLGGSVTARRSCISAPYATRGGALIKKAESVPLPHVPKHQRVSASVTGSVNREVAATLYDIRLAATAGTLGEAATAITAERERVEEALALLNLPGYDSFLLSVDAVRRENSATASAILRVEIVGEPSAEIVDRIAGVSGSALFRPAGVIFANAEAASEDQRAELEAAVRTKAAALAAARGNRLVELLESSLRPRRARSFDRDPDRASVDVTASATFRMAPDGGEAVQ